MIETGRCSRPFLLSKPSQPVIPNMKTLPADVTPYQRTKEFSETTIPSGLLREHSTKVGTWGRICVLEGRLSYEVPGPPTETRTLTPGTNGIVEPEILHHVRPMGRVRFFVEFLKTPPDEGANNSA
jgi:tellurite resistance-related uncharacterized protein